MPIKSKQKTEKLIVCFSIYIFFSFSISIYATFSLFREMVNLLYFNKTENDIWCRANLDSLAKANNKYVNLHQHHVPFFHFPPPPPIFSYDNGEWLILT